MIRSNGGYNNPELAQAAVNIAEMFGPPSASELAGYSTARANNQRSSIIAKLAENPQYQGFDHQSILADLYDPTQSFQKVNMDDATTRRGQDVAAQTSITNNRLDNKTDFITSAFGALGQGEVRPTIPGDIASTFELPALPQVAGLPKPRSMTEWTAAQGDRLLETGQINDDEIKALIMSGSELSASQEKINRVAANLVATGTVQNPTQARNLAVGIVDGRYREARDPMTGEVVVIDMATGGPAQLAAPLASGPLSGEAPIDPVVEAATRSDDPFGPQYPAAPDSFGVGGALAGGINRALDAVGVGAPYPDIQQTQADFGVLRENLMNDIADTYGRQPPSWLLQEIRSLTPDAGSPFEGAGGAQAKLNAIGRQLQSQIDLTTEALSQPLSSTNRQELQTRLGGLQMGLSRVQTALQAFGAVPTGAPTDEVPAGVDPADWQYMTEQEKALFR